MAIKILCGRLLLHSNIIPLRIPTERERVLFHFKFIFIYFISHFFSRNSFFLFFPVAKCVCFEFLCSFALVITYIHSFEAAPKKELKTKFKREYEVERTAIDCFECKSIGNNLSLPERG